MIELLKNHWAEIFIIVQTIARMTPTKKDDEIVSKIGKFINIVMLGSKNTKPKYKHVK